MQQENLKLRMHRLVRNGMKKELVSEVKMLKLLVFHLPLVSSGHAWILMIVSVRSIKSPMSVINTSLLGLIGNSRLTKT